MNYRDPMHEDMPIALLQRSPEYIRRPDADWDAGAIGCYIVVMCALVGLAILCTLYMLHADASATYCARRACHGAQRNTLH